MKFVSEQERHSAVNKLNQAIRVGKIKRAKACSQCGRVGTIHAHHDDYSKPLDVRFLCVSCHQKWHTKHGHGLVLMTRAHGTNRRFWVNINNALRMRLWRRRLKITQKKAAELIGVKPRFLSDLEHDRQRWKPEYHAKLVAYYGQKEGK